MKSPQELDILEQNGYSYNEDTFDDVFAKTYRDCVLSIFSDSSDDEDAEELKDNDGSKAGKQVSTSKSNVISKDDFIQGNDQSS